METNELLDEIFPRLDYTQLLSELDPKDHGAYLELRCPSCQEHEAFIYKDSRVILCNRQNSCGQKKSIWDFVQERGNFSQQETLFELAKAANYTITRDYSFDPRVFEAEKRRGTLLEEAQALFASTLTSKTGANAQKYLSDRGYSPTEIKTMDLGCFPTQADFTETLKVRGFEVEELEQAGLIRTEFGTTHQITIPYRSPGGDLKGFLVRTISGVEPKYLYTRGLKKDTLFNLNHARDCREFIIVEGYLDALILTARGIPGVVALGQSGASAEYLQSLFKLKPKRIFPTLDRDKAGQDGNLSLVRLCAEQNIPSYIISLPAEVKDPDELLRRPGGLEAFKAAIEEAKTSGAGARFAARHILATHDLTKDVGKKDAFSKAFEFVGSFKTNLDTKCFLEEIGSGLNLPSDLLLEELNQHREREATKQLNADVRKFTAQAQELAAKENTGELLTYLEEGARDLKLKHAKAAAVPKISQSERIAQKFEADSCHTPGTILGHPLKQFARLCEVLSGIQAGLYLFGAHTNVGKTAFLSNLAIDLLLSSQDTRILFFTLDDSWSDTINRFLAIFTRLDINAVKYGRSQGSLEDRLKIEAAYNKLREFADSGRLILRDIAEVSHIDQVDLAIREEAQQPGLCVFVDGLYNIEVTGRFSGLREMNIERANRLKALVDTYNLPLLATGELRKRSGTESNTSEPGLDDFMESGKFIYNADVVTLLFPNNNEPGALILKFDKNKVSSFKQRLFYEFQPAKSFICEQSEEIPF